MQRVLLLLTAVLALYACSSTMPSAAGDEKPAVAATEQPAPPAEPKAAVEAKVAAPVPPAPVAASVAAPVSAPAAAPAPAAPAAIVAGATPPAPAVLPSEPPFPHIALLLPLQSVVFGSSAEAVQQGFMTAANQKRQTLPVRVYSNFDENTNVVAVYRQAIANGARAVVGPLTRSGVSALAAEKVIPVPTLALNIVEGQPAEKLYFFGMSVESEARQAAQLAKQQGLHQAIIVTVGTQLSQRMQTAFEEEWGNNPAMDRGILREIEFNDDTAVFADIGDITDTMVFLAAEAERARLIRPYLPNKLPVYASSQIFVGNDKPLTNYDLNGIRFVDMPWLLQPDHPAVMIYPRSSPPLPVDRERLYALGIDAYRLIQLLIAGRVATALPLDGVSGRIQLSGHTFQREAIAARFVEGQARLYDAPFAKP